MAVEYIQAGQGHFYVCAYPGSSAFFARVMQIATRTNEAFWIVPGTLDIEE